MKQRNYLRKINEAKSQFFEEIDKIDKILVRLTEGGERGRNGGREEKRRREKTDSNFQNQK